ncbi:MAG: ribosomal protein S18-alanine N-acetyltransferase [Chloroflexi bacterium]|nr:ribosomal protein S18-alanine N-acetyltransferase [Chloroflexota bacterium]
MPFIIEPMTLEDVDTVSAVEKECFSITWPASAYRRELRNPGSSRYIVVRHITDNGASPTQMEKEHRRSFFSSLFPFRQGENGHQEGPEIVGFAGLWLRLDEAHVTTICVKPEYRGKGVGELLLASLFDIALDLGGSWLTLEVRVSNYVAQSLYRKYGFRESGTRRHYYSDNGEDALIMWSESIVSPSFQAELMRLKHDLREKLTKAESRVGQGT